MSEKTGIQKLIESTKAKAAADEFCTPAETAFVQRVWQGERRKGIPSATVLAHPDGVTEVLDTDEANVNAIKARLREPEIRVRGTVLPKPKRSDVAGLLEREQFNALMRGDTAEYKLLKSVERAAKRRAKK
jgi:hypothetical protein